MEKESKEVIAKDKKKEVKMESMESMNVYQKLAQAKVDFINSNVKKSGENKFANFRYFELSDIVTISNKIFQKLGLLFVVSFDKEFASGILYNTENKCDDTIVITSPYTKLETGNMKMNTLQALGSEQTYQRRYLYLNLLDIAEDDTTDKTIGKDEVTFEKKQPEKQKPKFIPMEKTQKETIENLIERLKEHTELSENINKFLADTNNLNNISKKDAPKFIQSFVKKLEQIKEDK